MIIMRRLREASLLRFDISFYLPLFFDIQHEMALDALGKPTEEEKVLVWKGDVIHAGGASVCGGQCHVFVYTTSVRFCCGVDVV